MSIQMTVDDMLTALRRADHPRKDELVAEAIAFAARLSDVLVAAHNDKHPEAAIVRSDDDRIELWDGGIMVGFSPEDGRRAAPMPDVLKGFDDAGWEWDESAEEPSP